MSAEREELYKIAELVVHTANNLKVAATIRCQLSVEILNTAAQDLQEFAG